MVFPRRGDDPRRNAGAGRASRLAWLHIALGAAWLAAWPLLAQSRDRGRKTSEPSSRPAPDPDAAQDPAEWLVQANAAFDRGEWNKASQLYGKVLELAPGNPIAIKRKREAEAKLAKERQAAEQARKLAENPRRRAAEAAREARENQARLAKERKSLPLYRETAKGLLADKDWTGAADYLKRIAAIEPNDAYVAGVLALRRMDAEILASQEDYRGAAQVMDWLCGIRADPSAVQQQVAWKSLAVLKDALRTENLKALNEALQEAERSAPGHALLEKARIREGELRGRRDNAPPSGALQPGTQWKDPVSGIAFCWIPAGTFTMGSAGGSYDERPRHGVTFARGFWMGRTEVTQRDWKAWMGSNPSVFLGDDLPVERVSWDDAKEFLRHLNEKGGPLSYRLPSEAEWEYACRAGTEGERYGDVNAIAWHGANSSRRTWPAGEKQANAWGLHDALGSVWEWCEDVFHDNYQGAPVDGSAWREGDQSRRIRRGGSWFHNPKNCRAAHRAWSLPSERSNEIGFRVVAVPRTP